MLQSMRSQRVRHDLATEQQDKSGKIKTEKKDGAYLWRAFNASLRSVLSIYYPCQRPSKKQKVY